jgi:hypothetical protein
MPYVSGAQSRFIHMKANQGVPWAAKFVADAQHGAGALKGLPEHVKRRNREIGKRLMASR